MADKPITANLPADLPENWQTNQIVSPSGTEVGLSEQHGYNYQSKQINDAQKAINAINGAFTGLATSNHTHSLASLGAAKTVTLTCTVPVSWTASGSYYTQTVAVTGMLAADNPVADILPGTDHDANKLYAEAWGKVQSITTLAGKVTIWCTEAPTVAFPVQFKVVR